jgi:hypothetical protein
MPRRDEIIGVIRERPAPVTRDLWQQGVRWDSLSLSLPLGSPTDTRNDRERVAAVEKLRDA